MAGRSIEALLFSFLAAAAADAWPRGRHSHCAVAYKNYMVVYGGHAWSVCRGVYSEMQLSDVWAFDLITLVWMPLIVPGIQCVRQESGQVWETAVKQNSGPGERAGHTCVVEEDLGGSSGSILTFGGSFTVSDTPSSVTQYTNDVWRLQLSGGQNGSRLTAAWMELDVRGAPPSVRGGHAAALIGGAMHVFGGCLGWGVDSAYGDLWALDPVAPGAGGVSGMVVQENSRPAYEWRQILGSNASSADANASSPVARCSHVGLAHPAGFLVTGGHTPLEPLTVPGSQQVPRWLTLADVWLFRTAEQSWVRVQEMLPTSAAMSVNRSHHAGVLHNRTDLLLLGGLWTDVVGSAITISILPNLLRLRLPDLSSLLGAEPVAEVAPTSISIGPQWVYDHSVVLARDSAGTLAGMPVVYGGQGQGGTASGPSSRIFEDVWVYSDDYGWQRVAAYGTALSGAASVFYSLVFGTVGFILYTCVIVCVFMRKLMRACRDAQNPSHWPDVGAPAGPASRPTNERRGVPQDVIDSLPRLTWAEMSSKSGVGGGAAVAGAGGAAAGEPQRNGSILARCRVGKAERSVPATTTNQPAGKKAAAEEDGVELVSAAAGGAGAAPAAAGGEGAPHGSERSDDSESEERELCSVCLCAYDAEDVLLRLPCLHVFHEACIARWLHQDCSCPQCRQLVSNGTHGPRPAQSHEWATAARVHPRPQRQRSPNTLEAGLAPARPPSPNARVAAVGPPVATAIAVPLAGAGQRSSSNSARTTWAWVRETG